MPVRLRYAVCYLLSGSAAVVADQPALAADALPDCPPGTHATGTAPPVGFEWRCDNASGVPEGPWLTWYADGKLMSERHMKNGREHGRQRSWWPNGQLMMEGISVEGNRFKGFKYWGIDGAPSNIDVKTEVIEHKLNQ